MASKAKPKKKVEVEYPKVPTKKWVPPDERPKEARPPAYVKPKRINQPLKISSLPKVWNHFIFNENAKYYILAGSYSQTHKRFRLKTKGMQGAANCIVACMMTKMFKMENWNNNMINQILNMGDSLYEKSIMKLGSKALGAINAVQVYPTFYVYQYMVNFQIINPEEPLKLVALNDQDRLASFEKLLNDFFTKNVCGIVQIEKRNVSLWRYENAFFLFDPTEHDYNGNQWKGLISTGFAICIRFTKLDHLVRYLIDDHVKTKTLKLKMWPIEMVRCQLLELNPPKTLEEVARISEESEKSKLTKIPQGMRRKLQESKSKPTEELRTPASLDNMKKAGPEVKIGETKSLSVIKKIDKESKVPVEPHIGKSVEHFTLIDNDKMGIIRATTHQLDKKFSRFRNGEQSLSQAVAALVMRRSYPSRQWVKRIVNEILKLGETIHHKSVKDATASPFNLARIVKKIENSSGTYQMNYEEFAVLGQLSSEQEGVLDLHPALLTFLRTYDCCIISGPQTLAVWFEDNRFYMYDPNERDERGKVIRNGDKQDKGVACVTWFNTLKDLVGLYMENTPKEERRSNFHLSKITIEDYVGEPEKWNNFQGISKGKWILRGTINQSSHIFPAESRNTQCTANAAMSIAVVHIKDVTNWSHKTIDQILMSGDEYYRATLERLRKNNKLISRLLIVDELNRNFPFSNKEVTFDIKECCVNGVIGVPDHGDVFNIKTGLQKFFEEFDFGILTCRNISIAVWKKDGAFYYFDSHSRDHKGMIAGYGTACVLRVLTIDDLTKSIEGNLKSDKISQYNIGAVNITLLDVTENEDIPRQPLNNYRNLGDNLDKAILLANTSNKDAKYEFNAGKQTVPQCVVALGMNKLRPSAGWNQEILANILDIGHKYFEDCMADYEASTEEVTEDKGITSRNLRKSFDIGVNKIEIELEAIAEGFVEEGLGQALNNVFAPNEKNLYPEVLVETENITVSVWKDANLFYIFDPYPRDDSGQVIGKDSWSAKLEAGTLGDATTSKSAEGAAGDAAGRSADMDDTQIGELPKRPKSRGEGVFEEDTQSVLDSDVNGKACAIFFYKLEDVVNHIIENTRPNSRPMMPFTITTIKLKNTPMVKEIYDKDLDKERKSAHCGDWNSFVEVDHGHWILRGQIDMNNEMFPKENRGEQCLPTIISALAFAKLFSMSKMLPKNITTILCYGDRLLTYVKRSRRQQLAEDKVLDLLEDEINAIMKNEKYGLESYPKTFVIGDFKVHMKLFKNHLTGEINAKDIPEVLDVKRGLDALFTNATYGILECKDYIVGIWKSATAFYMFDPHRTGVNGVVSTIGFPSITRYLKTDQLAEIFLQNLSKEGLNSFFIHKIDLKEEKYTRPKDVLEQPGPWKPLKITGFTEIIPGKLILRGSFPQDDPRFYKSENTLDAPVSVIALTMSLIHKSQTWSKPIVDEVITIADELFNQSSRGGGSGFNPWEDTMTPYNVPKDYRVGVMQANCHLGNTDQKGIFDTKDSHISNLRQGLEKFFQENTHGILFSPPNICYAIWEENNEGIPILYFFDPHRRDQSGLPSPHGTSCVLNFGSPKIAADHILECMTSEDRQNEFIIIPAEITVGPYKTLKKKLKSKHVKKATDGYSLMEKIAHKTIAEEKKEAQRRAEEQKKKAEAKKKFWQTRLGYFEIPKAQAILRGTKCLTSVCYQEKTRGFQGIPVCIVAFVANCIVPITDWTYKEIDTVLDTGDQLYIDSYIAYNPRDKMLGLQNVVRNIIIMNKRAHVTIYKPIAIRGFTAENVRKYLDKLFLDQNFALLNYFDQWVCVFFKRGYYFVFDPHGRGPSGCKISNGDGAACVLKFENLDDLSTKLVNNLNIPDMEEEKAADDVFELVLVRLEGGVCQCD